MIKLLSNADTIYHEVSNSISGRREGGVIEHGEEKERAIPNRFPSILVRGTAGTIQPEVSNDHSEV